MKKYILYPYEKNAYALVKYWGKNNNSEIAEIYSPKSYGLEGKDGGEVFEYQKLGYKIKSDYKEGLSRYDGVIIPPVRSKIVLEMICELIRNALLNGKDIICYCRLDESFQNELNSILAASTGKFINRAKKQNENVYKYNIIKEADGKWYIPEVPVVFVGEVLNEMQAGEIVSELFYDMKTRGYKVLALVDYLYAIEENMYEFPFFLYSNGLVNDQKVIALNSYIRRIVEQCRPNIILVQIPNPIMRQNLFDRDNFGVLPYIVSQCVNPDYSIICDVLRDIDGQEEYINYFKELNNCFWYRFGIVVNEILLNNIKIDLNSSYARGYVTSYPVKDDVAKEIAELLKGKLEINIHSSVQYDIRESSKAIIDKLSN